MMMDETIRDGQPSGTRIACYVAKPDTQPRCATVRHDSSFVTQLIANATDLPNSPKRRKADRSAPLAAYASARLPAGRTRRIA